MSDGATGCARRGGAFTAATARAALAAMLGEGPELRIAGRRYRLTLESVFRLEEVDGRFVFFLRNAGALGRRLRALGSCAAREMEVVTRPPRRGRDN
jgi:hypothetical protein